MMVNQWVLAVTLFFANPFFCLRYFLLMKAMELVVRVYNKQVPQIVKQIHPSHDPSTTLDWQTPG